MEACRSLQDVLQRIFIKEDRRKPEAIVGGFAFEFWLEALTH